MADRHRPTRSLTAFLALTALLALFASNKAAAQAPPVPRFIRPLAQCAGLGGDWRCGTVRVRLDRQDRAGKVDLGVAFLHHPGPPRPAIVALAGGPGSPALPGASFFARLLAPGLTDHDLVVFDQRGTGVSDSLDCPDIEANSSWYSGQVFACAQQLGPARRGFYRSSDTAADIEDLRNLLGIPTLTLFGISYGTKTATDYARLYPHHIEGLLLDSVVTQDTDPFYVYSARSIVRILRDECQQISCGFDPAVDVARLIASQRTGYITLSDGQTVSEAQLLDLFISNKAGLPGLPAIFHQAVNGDSDPLANDVSPAIADLRGLPTSRQDRTLWLATTCDDAQLPWTRGQGRSARLTAAGNALGAMGADFNPFTASLGWQYGVARLCASWPPAGAHPAPPPLPDVPALLLAGADDALTPVEEAQSVAASLPQAQLVVVPGATHVVLEQAACAEQALSRYFAGQSEAGVCQLAATRRPRSAR